MKRKRKRKTVIFSVSKGFFSQCKKSKNRKIKTKPEKITTRNQRGTRKKGQQEIHQENHNITKTHESSINHKNHHRKERESKRGRYLLRSVVVVLTVLQTKKSKRSLDDKWELWHYCRRKRGREKVVTAR